MVFLVSIWRGVGGEDRVNPKCIQASVHYYYCYNYNYYSYNLILMPRSSCCGQRSGLALVDIWRGNRGRGCCSEDVNTYTIYILKYRYIHIYLSIYLHLSQWIYVYIYIYIYICTDTSTHKYICMYIYKYKCAYTQYIYRCRSVVFLVSIWGRNRGGDCSDDVQTQINRSTYIHIYINLSFDIYAHIYVHVYTYINIHIYTHMYS